MAHCQMFVLSTRIFFQRQNKQDINKNWIAFLTCYQLLAVQSWIKWLSQSVQAAITTCHKLDALTREIYFLQFCRLAKIKVLANSVSVERIAFGLLAASSHGREKRQRVGERERELELVLVFIFLEGCQSQHKGSPI